MLTGFEPKVSGVCYQAVGRGVSPRVIHLMSLFGEECVIKITYNHYLLHFSYIKCE
ncbi:hypothetical protein EDC54_102322 [Samsonia erythrinae]|uniref:Uncharacterized protein n=1 Tax=Samsonia erythrinae TaxID=160434 RepID=A0A4R3VU35_9GAMM|nr:hypothetical protein EDC54_102322 [Samsonia erythrinae]